MPAIREYRFQTRVAGPVGGRRATAEDFGGGALAGAGQSLGQFAQALQQREERAEISDLNAKLAEAQSRWTVHVSEQLQSAVPGDTTIAEKILDDFDKYTDTLGEQAATRAGQLYLEQAVADLRGRIATSAANGQARLVGLKARQDYETSLNTLANTLLSDPSGYDVAVRRNELALALQQESGMTSELAMALRRQGETTLAKAAITGGINQDPGAALEALHSGVWDGRLNADDKLRLVNAAEAAVRRLETEGKQRESEAAARYLADFEDVEAFVLTGGVPTDDDYSRENLVAVLGPEKGGELADRMERAVDFGKVMSRVSFATPDELADMMAAETGDLASPEDFRAEAREADLLRNAVAQRQKALSDDPAAYVISAPTVGPLYERLVETLDGATASLEAQQAAIQSYAVATLAEQERLGVPEDQRRLLPGPYAEALASRFSSQQQGQNAAQLVQSLAEQWGNRWPQIMRQLSAIVPPDVNVIAAMPPGAAADRLAEVSKLSDKELTNALPSDAPRLIREFVADELTEFRGTLAGQVGGIRTYSTFATSAERLAMSYAAGGMSPDEAARRATAEIVNQQYEFLGTYRVPRTVDADAVASGARRAIGSLDGAMLDLPTSLAGLPEEETRVAYLSAIRANGYWVTAPDESGLVLYDGTGSAVTSNGRPIIRAWRQLTEGGPVPTRLIGGKGGIMRVAE